MSRAKMLCMAALAAAAAIPGRSGADEGRLKAALRGYSEVPAVSSTGMGRFTARVSEDGSAIEYELSYAGLEGATTAAANLADALAEQNARISNSPCTGPAMAALPMTGPFLPDPANDLTSSQSRVNTRSTMSCVRSRFFFQSPSDSCCRA